MNYFQKLKIGTGLAIIIGGLNMTNWKTTLAGVFAAAGQILELFGVPKEVGQAVSVLGLFILGLVSKDLNVTGGTKAQ